MLTIETRGDGGQYGVCFFEDNQQCEAWALLCGNCPVGGLNVTSYATDAGHGEWGEIQEPGGSTEITRRYTACQEDIQ
jgi:hypothetical protein